MYDALPPTRAPDCPHFFRRNNTSLIFMFSHVGGRYGLDDDLVMNDWIAHNKSTALDAITSRHRVRDAFFVEK